MEHVEHKAPDGGASVTGVAATAAGHTIGRSLGRRVACSDHVGPGVLNK